MALERVHAGLGAPDTRPSRTARAHPMTAGPLRRPAVPCET